MSKPRISIGKNNHATADQSTTRWYSLLMRAMQSDRSRLRELEIRVAHPQHWSAGEYRANLENLRQLKFRLNNQLNKLRQRAERNT
ncbi:hypothetical protein [Parasynechococcus marenigrum]|uniref:hypothetical protein n=1 Tax=Parasynechococcus marenigrum TaxID=2881428 RepID=UPI0011D2453B|nr:hypothetical protein [Parasynechococcus marenigrum]